MIDNDGSLFRGAQRSIITSIIMIGIIQNIVLRDRWDDNMIVTNWEISDVNDANREV